MALPLVVQVEIESKLENVHTVQDAVHDVCEQCGVEDDTRYDVELCVVEATTNVIRHAYKGRSGEKVSVTISADDDQIVIEVADRGELGFLCVRPIMIESSDIPSLPEGGMGLAIIRSVMDEVSYCSSKDGRNVFLMKKRWR